MPLTIVDLRSAFERKAALFRELKKYVKPIHEFAKDSGLAEPEQEQEHIFLEEHYFGHDKGLLPLVNGLIGANEMLLSREKPVFPINKMNDIYDKMIESVKREQYFLQEYFKRTIEDVVSRKGHKEYWEKSFSSYEKFLNRIRLGLTYLSWLLHIEASSTVNWVINLIHQSRFDDALAFIENEAKILSNEEVDFFRRFISALKISNFEEAKKDLVEAKDILEVEEVKVLVYVLNSIIAKQPKQIHILILRPINSLPENPIDIVSIYHQEKRDALEIGKSDQCDIQIVDSAVDDDIQAEILFLKNLERFAITPFGKSIVKINNILLENKSQFLNDSDLLFINGYEFAVSIRSTDKISITKTEYQELLQDKVLRLSRFQNEAAKIAEALAKEANEWDLLKKELPQITIPIPADKLPATPDETWNFLVEKINQEGAPSPEKVREEILDAIESIEEVAPEVEKIAEVRKKRRRGIRINLIRGMKKRRKKKRDYKATFSNAMGVLNQSINLRQRLESYVKSSRINKAIKALNEEFNNLTQLLRNIAELEIKFPNFRPQLQQLRNQVRSILDDITASLSLLKDSSKLRIKAAERKALSIFSALWSKLSINLDFYSFLTELSTLVAKKREEITKITINLPLPGISRRQLLKGLTAASALAVGGAVSPFIKKEEPKLETKQEVPPPKSKPAIADLKFEPVTLPEVNKTIYSEGNYKNATYIVVIPHSTELNALVAARQECRGPITYVAGNNDRNLKITINGRRYQIDPNRAFCTPGIVECFKEVNGKSLNGLGNEEQDYLFAVLKRFSDEIDKRIYHGKMVLALHQNTKGNFGIRSYERDLKFTVHAATVNVNPRENNDTFAYVNTRGWFEVLKTRRWNVVLQSNKRENDDGSLSYATTWRGFPYINIEVDLGNAKRQADMIRSVNELIDQYPQLATDMDFVPAIKKEIKQIAGTFNILLMGGDMEKNRKGMGERGDALVLINSDFNQKAIRILTIPRDTYVSVKGKKTKINHALAYGGWQLQKTAVEDFLGVKIDRVFHIDMDNMRDIMHLVRVEVGYRTLISDINKHLGFSNSIFALTWDKMEDYIRDRNLPEAAVGRAKKHAKMIAAVVKTLREYYNDPEKKIIFQEDKMKKILMQCKYTDIKVEDAISLVNGWCSSECDIELYCIPGRAQNLEENGKKVSYWIADQIPGTEDNFTKFINYKKSRII